MKSFTSSLWFTGLVSAALTSAADAAYSLLTNPDTINWQRVGTVALCGAALGVVNYLRTPPNGQK